MSISRSISKNITTSIINIIINEQLSDPVIPVFTLQPDEVIAGYISEDLTIESRASGRPSPTYQWQLNSGSGFTNISGITNRTLILEQIELSQDGNLYRCLATNTEGTTASNTIELTVLEYPSGTIFYEANTLMFNSVFLTYTG